MRKSCRVLLCDDREMLRSRCREMLAQAAGIEVVGEADGGHAAIQMALSLVPDLILMDVDMPDLDGIEATRRILARQPAIKILAYSSGSHWQVVREMLSAGASGYLVKGVDPEELISAIRVLLAGGHFLSGKIQVPLAPRFERGGLSNPAGKQPVHSAEAVKVLVVCQSPATREKLTRLLSAQQEITVLSETSDMTNGLALLRRHKLDVLVWDLSSGGETTAAHLRVAKQENPSLLAVVLTNDSRHQSLTYRAELGADFVFHNPIELERVVELCQMLAHTRWLNMWFAKLPPDTQGKPHPPRTGQP